MKRIFLKKITALISTLAIATVLVNTVPIAKAQTTGYLLSSATNGYAYQCSTKITDNNVVATFESVGVCGTGSIKQNTFTASSASFPNSVTFGDTWSYSIDSTGYAKGTYTASWGAVTQWISGTMNAETNTIAHVYNSNNIKYDYTGSVPSSV